MADRSRQNGNHLEVTFLLPWGPCWSWKSLDFSQCLWQKAKLFQQAFMSPPVFWLPLLKIVLLKSRLCLLLLLFWILMFSISMWRSCQVSIAVLKAILHPHQHGALLNLSPLCGVFLFSRYCHVTGLQAIETSIFYAVEGCIMVKVMTLDCFKPHASCNISAQVSAREWGI